MATFSERVLVSLADPANLPNFLLNMNLNAFLLRDFRRRFNTEFWNIANVASGAVRVQEFEKLISVEKRMMGRQEQHNLSGSHKTLLDYRYYGNDQSLWVDVVLDLDTTWDVDQFPGTISISETTPASYNGMANLVSVLRIDTSGHPLDATGIALANVTLDTAGNLQTNDAVPIVLTLDPLAGALRAPDSSIHSLVTIELFPKVGPTTPLLGVPLNEAGQVVPDLRMDHLGQFTDFAGAAVALDPVSNVPLDAAGHALVLARLAAPGSSNADFRFFLSLPVVNNRLTLQVRTRVYLLLPQDVDLVRDLRQIVTLRQHLETRPDYLLKLDENERRLAHVFALVYEANSLNGTGLTAADVQQFGDQMGTIIHFFPEP